MSSRRIPRVRFSLRTLLVAITVAGFPCAYVAHEAQRVRERDAWHPSHTDFPRYWNGENGRYEFAKGDPRKGPSFVRRLFGDEPRLEVFVEEVAPLAEKQAAAALFPEATVYITKGGDPDPTGINLGQPTTINLGR